MFRYSISRRQMPTKNISNFVHCGCGDNGFAASFTISIFNVLIATFLFSNGVKIELC